MSLGKEVGLGQGHIVLYGDPVAKWSPISATAERLFFHMLELNYCLSVYKDLMSNVHMTEYDI